MVRHAVIGSSLQIADWHDFYVVVGTAAGALTGLQFVVIALLQGRSSPRSREAARSYATPTVVHFATVLVLSAILSMPSITRAELGAILLVVGLLGLVYVYFIFRNDRRQDLYTADLEDTIWHFTLPPLAYASLLLAGASAWSSPTRSLYMVAGSLLALLVVGIHNAWDSAVYMLFNPPRD
jgi:cytochrome bd-type quinol oxidase subunit 2